MSLKYENKDQQGKVAFKKPATQDQWQGAQQDSKQEKVQGQSMDRASPQPHFRDLDMAC
jgi:hypothetical protein